MGHDYGISVDANSTYGPVLSATGKLDSTGDESHPLANFGL